MTFEEAEKIIFPTKKIPENLDLVPLKMKFIINKLEENLVDLSPIFSMVCGSDFYSQYTEKEICREVFAIFYQFENFDNIEESLVKYRFSDAVRKAFEEDHMGDCTAFPASCIRCYYRELLGLPDDSPSKMEGNKASFIYYEEIKRRKNAL